MDYMAHYEKSPRMWSQGLHAHDFYEIYIHLDGGRHYCVDDIVYELKPNQMLIVPPLHMHGLVCDRDLVDYERCYLYLSPEMLRKCDIGKLNLPALFDSVVSNHKVVSDLTAENALLCKEYLMKIELLDNSPNKLMDVYSKIFKILQIAYEASESAVPSITSNITDKPVISVLHYINEHFTEDINVQSISHLFNMSESSLSHTFRNYVNKGVYEYILYKRIIYARELMFTTDSLTEIAFKCGFTDYSNFLRVFKKQTGHSPKEYRQK